MADMPAVPVAREREFMDCHSACGPAHTNTAGCILFNDASVKEEPVVHVEEPVKPAVTAMKPVALMTTEVSLDDVNEVLDLLVPNGFKAKHLPAIEEWKQATVRLLNEVND